MFKFRYVFVFLSLLLFSTISFSVDNKDNKRNLFFAINAFDVDKVRSILESISQKQQQELLNSKFQVGNKVYDDYAHYVLIKGSKILGVLKEHLDTKQCNSIAHCFNLAARVSSLIDILTLLTKYRAHMSLFLLSTRLKMNYYEVFPELISFRNRVLDNIGIDRPQDDLEDDIDISDKIEKMLAVADYYFKFLSVIGQGSLSEAKKILNTSGGKNLKEYGQASNDKIIIFLTGFLDNLKKGEFTQNKDILKSILLGSVCDNCNKDIVKESLEWQVYNISKGFGFKKLGKYIREMAELILKLKDSKQLCPEEEVKLFIRNMIKSVVKSIDAGDESLDLEELPSDVKIEIMKFKGI